MSPISLTMSCSMLSSSSKELVSPSSCVAIMPKCVHKKKHVADSHDRFNTYNRTENNHTPKAKMVTNFSEHPMPAR